MSGITPAPMRTRKPTPEVAAASEQLVEELRQAQAPRRSDFMADVEQRMENGAGPKLGAPMQRLVEKTFLLEAEVDAAADRLTGDIVIGPGRADYGTVMSHLDRAEENARLAFRLMVTGKREREAFEADAEVQTSAMRNEAVRHLEEEKKDGSRTKQITDADVLSKMAALFGDEWKSLALARRSLDLTVKALEHQVDNWASRCRTLQTIASKLR